MWPSSIVSYMFEMMLDKKAFCDQYWSLIGAVLVTNIDLYWFTSRPVLVRSLTSTGKKCHLYGAS